MDSGPSAPVLVHSDLRELIRRTRVAASDRGRFTTGVVDRIRDAFVDRPLWMPAFNYEFARSGLFDVRTTPSMVGVLSEDFRTTRAAWRSPVPVFSIAGEGAEPNLDPARPEVRPFGTDSLFARLTQAHGSVVMVGCGISFATLIHHAEVADGLEPLYRYEKTFTGRIVDAQNAEQDVTVVYHVTDLRRRVTYNWPRIHSVMADDGALEFIDLLGGSWAIDARTFVDIWVNQAVRDPLWAISDDSRAWVEPLLGTLGRGFRRADFEGE